MLIEIAKIARRDECSMMLGGLRRELRAAELDLRYRDQVIARLP
jgi:hypothetical protein